MYRHALMGVIVLCCSVLSACATSPPPATDASQTSSLVETQLPFTLENNAKVLLLPVQNVIDDLNPIARNLFEVFAARLTNLHFDVFEMGEREWDSFRKQALQISGSVYSPAIGQYVPLDKVLYRLAFLKLLRAYGEYDLLISPELLLLPAQYEKGYLFWDAYSAPLYFLPLDASQAERGKLAAAANWLARYEFAHQVLR